MSASASLIPELEDVIQHGSQDKRAATVKRIANLFVDGAPHFNEDHIGLFDDVLCRLIVEIETKARAEMAQTLAHVGNAPIELMRKLAGDDDIAVAGPVLTQSATTCRKPSWSSSPAPRVRPISPPSPDAKASARRSPTCWFAAATPR